MTDPEVLDLLGLDRQPLTGAARHRCTCSHPRDWHRHGPCHAEAVSADDCNCPTFQPRSADAVGQRPTP